MIENETQEEIKQDVENRGGGDKDGETTKGRGEEGGRGRGGRRGGGEEGRRSLDDVWRKLKAKEDEGRKENGVRGRIRRGGREEERSKEDVTQDDVVRSRGSRGRGIDATKHGAKHDADEGQQRQTPGEGVDNNSGVNSGTNSGAVKTSNDDAGDVATTTIQKGAGKTIEGGKTTPENRSHFTDNRDGRKSGNRYGLGC